MSRITNSIYDPSNWIYHGNDRKEIVMIDPNDPVIAALRADLNALADSIRGTLEGVFGSTGKALLALKMRIDEIEKQLPLVPPAAPRPENIEL